MTDENDLETIINNQAVIMTALLDLAMAAGRDLAVKGLMLRLDELKLRKLDKLEAGQRAQRQI